ncbi:hypothetical protein Tco_0277287 [Tanacetum coccineum]
MLSAVELQSSRSVSRGGERVRRVAAVVLMRVEVRVEATVSGVEDVESGGVMRGWLPEGAGILVGGLRWERGKYERGEGR